ncbi:glycoside hydrolase family 71 protein [Saccharata proteae CBS 121410]|uniref:Glycoside hydrolase family 71 protein n=1 Tax=Saccharata proteae CBS 121410 TaxID=1314787 RepID=A0A9P4HY65_9PEZI|nr:glycoside hydrolase family 71 protein [Saccharata proteae CBS 121410]
MAALSRVASARYVFATFKVENAESYTQETWQEDIASAKATGIDGFDCQSQSTDWQFDRIRDAFDVAESQHFQLFHSFDMSYHSRTANCPTGKAWNETFMASVLSTANTSSAAYRWNGHLLVSTYEGELYGDGFFTTLKDDLSGAGVSISLAPALTSYSEAATESGTPSTSANQAFSEYTSIDGFFNAFAWPYNVDRNLSCAVDAAFSTAVQTANRSGPFIMAVSPWLFQDLDTGNPADSFVQYSDTLWYYRWYEAINDVQPDIITIISWNDYISSNYIRDLPPATGAGSVSLGSQENYVAGVNHTAWRTLAQYYITYYKSANGTAPEIVNNDLVYWYRIHSKSSPCAGGTGSASVPVRNARFPADAVFIYAAVRANSLVEVYFGTNPTTRSPRPGTPRLTFDTTNQTEPWLFRLPFPPDFPRNASDRLFPQIVVDPEDIAYAKYDSVPITAECAWENFNPVVQSLGSDFDAVIFEERE